jgi:hypothetical protein
MACWSLPTRLCRLSFASIFWLIVVASGWLSLSQHYGRSKLVDFWRHSGARIVKNETIFVPPARLRRTVVDWSCGARRLIRVGCNDLSVPLTVNREIYSPVGDRLPNIELFTHRNNK